LEILWNEYFARDEAKRLPGGVVRLQQPRKFGYISIVENRAELTAIIFPQSLSFGL
jgi:hypothetical protein